MPCPECGHIVLSSMESIPEVIEHIIDMGDVSVRLALDGLRTDNMDAINLIAGDIARACDKAGAEIDYLWVGDSLQYPGCHELIFWGPRRDDRPDRSETQQAVAVALLEAQYNMVMKQRAEAAMPSGPVPTR